LVNGGDIIKVTKSVMLLEKSYPPGDHILRVFCSKFWELGNDNREYNLKRYSNNPILGGDPRDPYS
jgi:hypothetical protein